MYVIENPQDIIVSRIENHISIILHSQNVQKAPFEYPERTDLGNGCFTLKDLQTQLDKAYTDCVVNIDVCKDGNLDVYTYRTKLKEWWFLGSMPEK